MLIAIPISLVGTFFAMFALHYTLNIVSLMALGLCIGILVDDSIVVLENVDRHITWARIPCARRWDGRMEIGLAAVAITLCDVVVFAPIAFLPGHRGPVLQGVRAHRGVRHPPLPPGLLHGDADDGIGDLYRPTRQTENGADRADRGGAAEERTKGGWAASSIGPDQGRLSEAPPLGPGSPGGRWWFGIAILVVASLALLPLGAWIQSEFIQGFDQSKLVVDLDLGAGYGYPQTEARRCGWVEKYLLGVPEVTDTFATIGSEHGGVPWRRSW